MATKTGEVIALRQELSKLRDETQKLRKEFYMAGTYRWKFLKVFYATELCDYLFAITILWHLDEKTPPASHIS